jgi:iron complex outermembrane recepter protein
MKISSRVSQASNAYRLGAGLVALATATALVSAQPAWAADTDAEETKDTRDTIIVTGEREPASTASKTGTATRDIPASIQTLSAEAIEDQAGLVLNEVVRNVSGVQPIYGGGYGYADNYVIRSLRMKFLRDGVSDGPTFVGYARSFSDVERVEILKGPGSAIYGRSEPGGIINLVTKQPSFTPLANVSLTIGSRDTYNIQGDLSGPITSNLALRGTGEYSTTDGIRGLSKKIATGAVALLWNIADNQRLTAKGEIYRQDFIVDNYGIPAGFDGNPVNVNRNTRYYTPDNFVDQKIKRFTLSYSAEPVDALTLRATYRYDGRDLDFCRNALFTLNAAQQISSINQREHIDDSTFQIAQAEAVITSTLGGIKGKTLVGYEYQRDRFSTIRREFTFNNIQNLLAPSTVASAAGLTPRLIFDRELAADTHSVYFQHEAAIGELIRLRGGYRFDFANYTDVGVSTATPVAGQAGPLNRRFDETLQSGQIGVVIQPTSTLSFYGGYSRGAFVNIQTESTALSGEPETSNQIEAGVKWDVTPKLNLNLAVFKVKRRNYNITLIPGGLTTPDGAQDAKGLEIDINGEILPGLTLLANYAYLDAFNVSREVGTTFPGAGVAQVRRSIFGLEPAASVRHSGSVWATYDLKGIASGLGIGAGITAKGRSFADTVNAIRIPGYTIGNAAIYWRQPKYEIALNVKNVTNERYFENPTFAGGLPGDPRTVLLTLKAKM